MASLENVNYSVTENDHTTTGRLEVARKLFVGITATGVFSTALLIFGIISIYWGALWKVPDGKLSGWIVDFDGEMVGAGVTQGLLAAKGASAVAWTVVPAAQFPGGISQLAYAVLEQKTWAAISINEGSTSRLTASLNSPNASYQGTEAISVFAVEARNEFAYRSLIVPPTQAILGAITERIALNTSRQVATSNNTSLLTSSPQTLIQPVSFKLINLAPFNIPVASAMTFVGLLYQAILAFFIVMIGVAARQASGIEKLISLKSLIAIRLIVPFVAYFLLSLCYSLLSLAFQVSFDRKFGHSGFVIFWMVNWLGMLASGLAFEAMVTLLTQRFIAFFLLTYIIVNVSVCIVPLEVLPAVFRYGYASPFYNMSRAIRTILFGTKNTVGFNIGVLIAWVAISCITLPLFQWLAWRKRTRTLQGDYESKETVDA